MSRNDWGLLLLDKPTGITSHTAVRKAARFLGIKKSGHAGTLDPLASGLMLVGLGKGTRLLEYLVGCDKSYDAKIRLGVSTDTLDREGVFLEESPVDDIAQEDIVAVLKDFTGELEQIPPIYSSIKQNGVPLHRRARRGEEVEVSPRHVRIDEISFRSWEPPFLEISVSCSSGTYIRSLARDIGDRLGAGATLWELRRTRCGIFSVDNAVAMEVLEKKGEECRELILSPTEMVRELPFREIDEDERKAIAYGVAIECGASLVEGSESALISAEKELVAIATVKNGKLRPRKVFI